MPSPDPEELAARGLYDPADELAAERLELIEYLLSIGATVDELVAADPDLAQVASTRALLGAGERFTQAEAASACRNLDRGLGAHLARCVASRIPGPTQRSAPKRTSR